MIPMKRAVDQEPHHLKLMMESRMSGLREHLSESGYIADHNLEDVLEIIDEWYEHDVELVVHLSKHIKTLKSAKKSVSPRRITKQAA